MLLHRKQLINGIEKTDTVEFKNIELAWEAIQKLFKLYNDAVYVERADYATGGHSLCLKNRDRKIIYSLKTTEQNVQAPEETGREE